MRKKYSTVDMSLYIYTDIWQSMHLPTPYHRYVKGSVHCSGYKSKCNHFTCIHREHLLSAEMFTTSQSRAVDCYINDIMIYIYDMI